MHTPDTNRRYRNYWVRNYDPDTLSYTLSPVDGKGDAIQVKVDQQGDKNRVSDALLEAVGRQGTGGTTPVRCVLRRDAKTGDVVVHQVVPSDLSKDRDSRKVIDPTTGQVISTWTADLDKAVTRHSEWTCFRAAMEQQKLLIEDPAFFASVRQHAMGLLEKEVARGHADGELTVITPGADLNRYLHESFVGALRGVEHDNYGAVRQRRYDANASFREQTRVEDSQHGLTQLGNYAMQRAIVERLAEAAALGKPKGDRNASLAEVAQDELLRQQALLGGHPTKDADDFRAESMETARIIGAAALAGALDNGGAKATNKAYDPLRTYEAVTGHPIDRFLIHGEIKREIKSQDPEGKLSETQKIHAYANLGSDRARRYTQQEALKTYGVQLAVATKGANKAKPPHEPKDDQPPITGKEVANAAGAGVAAAAKGLEQAIKESGEIPLFGL